MEKIVKSNLKKIHSNEFAKKISSKRIFGGSFVAAYSPNSPNLPNWWRGSSKAFSLRPEKISLDDMIALNYAGKLKESPVLSREGDFVIDLSNPLALILYEKISSVQKKAYIKYDAKVIDDYFNDAKHFAIDFIGMVSDLFRPSRWGAYHSWAKGLNREEYNASSFATGMASVRYCVNQLPWRAYKGAGAMVNSFGKSFELLRQLGKESVAVSSIDDKFSGLRLKNGSAKSQDSVKPSFTILLNWIMGAGAKTASYSLKLAVDLGYVAYRSVTNPKPYLRAGSLAVGAGVSVAYFSALSAIWLASNAWHAAKFVGVESYSSFLSKYSSTVNKLRTHFASAADDFSKGENISIKKLSRGRLEYLTRTSGLGEEFRILMDVAQRFEDSLSSATGLSSREVAFQQKRGNEGIPAVSDSSVIYLNFGASEAWKVIQELRSGDPRSGEAYLGLLDCILHEKAHQTLDNFSHDYANLHNYRQNGDLTSYDGALYQAKDTVSLKLKSYLEASESSIEGMLEGIVPADSLGYSRSDFNNYSFMLALLNKMNFSQLRRVKENIENGLHYYAGDHGNEYRMNPEIRPYQLVAVSRDPRLTAGNSWIIFTQVSAEPLI